MKYSWDFLNNYDYTQPIPSDVRTDKTNELYNELKKKINISIEEFVMINFLKNKKKNICINDFPYDNTSDTIYHYVYWISPDYENIITNNEFQSNSDTFK